MALRSALGQKRHLTGGATLQREADSNEAPSDGDEAECTICGKPLGAPYGLLMDSCEHVFHFNCITQERIHQMSLKLRAKQELSDYECPECGEKFLHALLSMAPRAKDNRWWATLTAEHNKTSKNGKCVCDFAYPLLVEEECAICELGMVSPRFAILQNCYCIFHERCLVKYRSLMEAKVNKETLPDTWCPSCRINSGHIELVSRRILPLEKIQLFSELHRSVGVCRCSELDWTSCFDCGDRISNAESDSKSADAKAPVEDADVGEYLDWEPEENATENACGCVNDDCASCGGPFERDLCAVVENCPHRFHEMCLRMKLFDGFGIVCPVCKRPSCHLLITTIRVFPGLRKSSLFWSHTCASGCSCFRDTCPCEMPAAHYLEDFKTETFMECMHSYHSKCSRQFSDQRCYVCYWKCSYRHFKFIQNNPHGRSQFENQFNLKRCQRFEIGHPGRFF